MNGSRFLVDTNIILYLLNGDETLAEILNGKHVFVSFITELELYGFKKLTSPEKKRIDKLLSNCSVIDINYEIKSKTIQIRQDHDLKLPDSIIAATSLYLNIPLVSADKHFERVNSISLLRYEN